MLADTAGIKEKTVLSTPPSKFKTPPSRPPKRPPDGCCGGVLYCTMTLMLLDEFASKACRSGEILVLSANARLTSSRKNARKAVRAARLEYFSEYAGMTAIPKARQTPEHKCSGMKQIHSWAVLF